MRKDSKPLFDTNHVPIVLFIKTCASCGAVEERVFEDSWTGLELCAMCLGGVINQVTMSPASEGDNLIEALRTLASCDDEQTQSG